MDALIEFLKRLGAYLGPAEPVTFAPLVRLLVAAVLGAGIGWERERHGRAAGLRTHMLLCTGSALIMLISLFLPSLFFEYSPDANVRVDASRVASQALSGLGFLGGGAILVLGQRIRGLTTAACIWITAAIGLAVGAGYFAPALLTWGLTVFALVAVGIWERRMTKKDQYIGLKLRFNRPARRFPALRDLLKEKGLTVVEYTVDRRGKTVTYKMSLRYAIEPDFEEVTHQLYEAMKPQGIEQARWGIAEVRT
jgi:putative Mg2+ transporter-C (MgtC) family protein